MLAKSYAIAEGEIIVYYVFILHEDSTRTIVVPTTGSREFDLVILNPHARVVRELRQKGGGKL